MTPIPTSTIPRRCFIAGALFALLAGLTACGGRSASTYDFQFCDQTGQTNRGSIRTATCEGAICDPAPYRDCGDGTCVLDPGSCTKPTTYTFTYCDEGTIRTSTCEGGLCDPAPFDDCGDGTCVLGPGTCRKAKTYTFEYCDEGTIHTSTCDGLCDPAPFDDCGDGTCVLSPGTCPATSGSTCGCAADEFCVRFFDGVCTDMGTTCIKLPPGCAGDPCGSCAALICGTSGIFACGNAAPPCSPPAGSPPWEFDEACYGY